VREQTLATNNSSGSTKLYLWGKNPWVLPLYRGSVGKQL